MARTTFTVTELSTSNYEVEFRNKPDNDTTLATFNIYNIQTALTADSADLTTDLDLLAEFSSNGTYQLESEDLNRVSDEAVSRWLNVTGGNPEVSGILDNLSYSIVDLPKQRIGQHLWQPYKNRCKRGR